MSTALLSRKITPFFVLFLGLTMTDLAQARWSDPSEADSLIELDQVEVHVRADGSSTSDASMRVKVLNETGRARWGTLHFGYSPKNTKMQIVRAETVLGENTFKVPKSNIVDTQISATENGFDETRQIVIPFAQVEVGSEVFFQFKQENFRPQIANQFYDRFSFGDGDLQNAGELFVQSERPLYFQVNDPEAKIEFTKSEKPGRYEYRFHLKEPVFQKVVDEIMSIVPEKKLIWIAVSSAPTYADMLTPLSQRYEKILNTPLPEIFQSLLKEAKLAKDPIRKINLVTSELAKVIRYMGDWRSVDGAFVPRTFEQMSQTRFGDCKDFSTLTVRLLRELGIESYVAIVYRGVPARLVTDVAYLNFNHAIVSVPMGARTLWVDPTNFQSDAENVGEDIAGRPAVVLNPQKVETKFIDFSSHERNQEKITLDLQMLGRETRADKIRMDLSGALAFAATGAELQYSKAQFESATVAGLANMADVIEYKFSPFDLTSRIVQPIHLQLSLKKYYHPVETSQGPSLDFDSPDILKQLVKVESGRRESDLRLGLPSGAVSEVNLANVAPEGKALKTCKVKSPWLDFSFIISPSRLQVVRDLQIKKSLITAAEIRSQAFTDFQADLQTCSRGRYLIFKPASKKHLAD